jgi:RimJ/RimL family protein N-acetyltransferase
MIVEGSLDPLHDLKTLHTPRLRLEPLEERHAPAMFAGLRHEALYEFISECAPESAEALRERYRRLESRVSPDGRESWLNWALWSLPGGGYVGWVQATVHSDHSADIAYVLFHEAWGHGFAREAAGALIDHLRDAWSATNVRATVDVRNRRSIAVLKALGFRRGVVRRNAAVIRGAPADEVEYRRWLE